MRRPGWIPRNERKTILFLGDDLRIPSGIGTMSREIVEGTCHIYNWVQLGAAIQHPDFGKIINMDESISSVTGVEDASVTIFPYNGYGDQHIIRQLIKEYNPSAILHFTDPRYWIWLYQLEHEIRQQIPLLFYTIWDDLPYPYYNENFYRSCDWFGCISKQTYNIIKQVRARTEPVEPWQLSYIPHGINSKKFFKIDKSDEEEMSKLENLRKGLLGDVEDPFVILYNSRNIKRKMTSDIILAFNEFYKQIDEKDKNRVFLLMHTAPVEEAGTDLPAVIRDVTPDIKSRVKFSTARMEQDGMNGLYNIADVVINISSNEGFGLSIAEGLMAETPSIMNVTGGLQDQAGFVDENGEYLDPEKHYSYNWGTNHDGRYKKHGEWCTPVFPNSFSLMGSPLTPYIFDDRCDYKEVAEAMKFWFDMPKEERERRGRSGREFCLGAGGLNSENMCNLFIDGMENAMKNFKPRTRFKLEEV